LRLFQTIRSRSQLGNAPGESRAFRNEPIEVRDAERRVRLTSRAVRIQESCERRAGSGTQANRTGVGRAAAAVAVEAWKKYRTAERGCAEKMSTLRVNRARVTPARHTSGGNRAPRQSRQLACSQRWHRHNVRLLPCKFPSMLARSCKSFADRETMAKSRRW